MDTRKLAEEIAREGVKWREEDVPAASLLVTRLLPLLERAQEEWAGPRISRCAQCGAEGGAVFLVCADCWAPPEEKRDA